MIKKIKTIKNVGKFKHFSETDDAISFGKNTFIFAKNTQGKSTLGAILKSLTTNNPDYIVGRKTFNSTVQNVAIEIDSDYVFNTAWNKNYKIKIFDSDYILENVYSNDLINEDKQERIASLILGEKGKELEKAWQDARLAISVNAQREREISAIYSSTFDKTVEDFSDFLKLKDKKDISNEIKSAKNKLDSFNNQEEISSVLQDISDKIDEFSLDKTELDKTLQLDQKIINDHLSEHLKTSEGAINFISSGLNIMKDSKCPFCSQDIVSGEPAKLLEAYNVLFSENYKTIKKSLREAVSFLNNWEFEKNVLTYFSKLGELGLNTDFGARVESASAQRKNLMDELNKKNSDLTYEINFETFEEIKNVLLALKDEIEKLKTIYGRSFSESDLANLKVEIAKLEIQEKRFKKTWIDLSDEYTDLEKKYEEDLKPKEELTFKAKNDYANGILSEYQTAINDILSKLGADFELTSFSFPENRIEKIKLFKIKFNGYGNEVSLTDSGAGYSIKNTLSDSDKRLLAFAFFVVDIKNTKDLSDYIVVLDDPMSSFDIDRKRQTIMVLRDELFNVDHDKPQQLIVLTHESNFFTLLDEYFTDDKKFLSIKYSKEDDTSKIVPCDIDDEFLKQAHYKKLEYYEKCASGEIEDINLSDMRVVLEEAIKSKNYLKIDKSVISSGSIINWYKENVGTDEINQKIDDIFPNLSHHTQSDGVSETVYEEGEKRAFVVDFLNLLLEI